MQTKLHETAHLVELVPQQIDVLGKRKNKQQLAEFRWLNAETAKPQPALIAAVFIAEYNQRQLKHNVDDVHQPPHRRILFNVDGRHDDKADQTQHNCNRLHRDILGAAAVHRIGGGKNQNQAKRRASERQKQQNIVQRAKIPSNTFFYFLHETDVLSGKQFPPLPQTPQMPRHSSSNSFLLIIPPFRQAVNTFLSQKSQAVLPPLFFLHFLILLILLLNLYAFYAILGMIPTALASDRPSDMGGTISWMIKTKGVFGYAE